MALVCSNPFRTKGGDYVGCGQCMACRVKRRCEWATRIQLESRCHLESCCLTLTYADKHLPEGAVLVKRDLQLFIKRLRKHFGQLRYFGVGEYGEQFGRPHFHVCIFGKFISQEEAEKVWGKGRCSSDLIDQAVSNYVAGYVVKKWTASDADGLNGRPPEFTLMSLKPGIGALAVPQLAAPLADQFGQLWISGNGDVPALYRFGQKERAIGRYLRGKLREVFGRDGEEPIARYRRNVEVSDLRQAKRRALEAEGLSPWEATWAERSRPGHVDFNKAAALSRRQKLKGSL